MKQHPTYAHFLITEDGQIFSTKSNKYLKTVVHPKGYRVFCTRLNGRDGLSKFLRVHRLVAETYIENPDNKPYVNHKDGDKLNNHVSNLEWVTSAENAQHSWDTGLSVAPDRDSNSLTKIPSALIETIRNEYKPFSRTHGLRSLGRKYGVAHTTLSRVLAAPA